MVGLTLTSGQIDSLEFRTAHAYESFERAVRTKEVLDVRYVRELYKALGSAVSVAVKYSPFIDWNRGTQRADLMDRYVLQVALSNTSPLELEQATNYEKTRGEPWPSFNPTEVTEKEVKDAINNKRIPYWKISSKATHLGSAGRFDEVVRLIKYVRDTIPVPQATR